MAKKPPPAAPAAAPSAAPPFPPTAQAAPPVAPSVAPAPPVPQLPFKIEVGVALPERTRVGNTTGEPSPFVAYMKSMPAEVAATDPNAQPIRASFFIPAKQAPATIVDPTERDKFAKDEARKTTNNIGAISRRIKKADATYNFTTREVTEGGVRGVRVWRVAPVAAEAPQG